MDGSLLISVVCVSLFARSFVSFNKPIKYLTLIPDSKQLVGQQISDLHPLGSLYNLTKLRLAANKVSDLSPLRSHTKLKELDLTENQIRDLQSSQ